jgi:hypothetical protein
LLEVVLEANEQEVSLSLNSLRDLEVQRLCESGKLVNHNITNLDETSSVCSLEENLELEALNLICSDITEDLGDGGCDLCVYRPPYHSIKRHVQRVGRKLKKGLDERNFLEL